MINGNKKTIEKGKIYKENVGSFLHFRIFVLQMLKKMIVH